MKPPERTTAVGIFARNPTPGKVKTRLMPRLGGHAAAELHRKMVTRTVDVCAAAGVGPVGLWLTPGPVAASFNELACRYGLGIQVQHGEELGARMYHALRCLLATAGSAVLVGSDCPFLQESDLMKAAQRLDDGDDLVLGPALDGGYYLVGLRVCDRRIFEGVAWGTSTVFADTCERAKALGWTLYTLPQRPDIDRPEDLTRLDAVDWRGV